MIYYCDYTKDATVAMKKFGLNNADIQEVFNKGFSETSVTKFLDKDGFRVKIYFNYDAYTLRYVILAVFKRPLKIK